MMLSAEGLSESFLMNPIQYHEYYFTRYSFDTNYLGAVQVQNLGQFKFITEDHTFRIFFFHASISKTDVLGQM